MQPSQISWLPYNHAQSSSTPTIQLFGEASKHSDFNAKNQTQNNFRNFSFPLKAENASVDAESTRICLGGLKVQLRIDLRREAEVISRLILTWSVVWIYIEYKLIKYPSTIRHSEKNYGIWVHVVACIQRQDEYQ
jgi:hypothetical protein